MSGKVLEDYPGQRPQVEGIHLHYVANIPGNILSGFPDGIWALALAFPYTYVAWRRFLKYSPLLEVSENSACHGYRYVTALLLNQYRQLVFAPSRVLLSDVSHCIDLPDCPGRASDVSGAMGTFLQAEQVSRVITVFPSIKSLRADSEIPACEAGIAFMSIEVIKPL